MNKDRGTMKWTSLMLPEHIERLRAWEEELQVEKPKQWSEWELHALDQTIHTAYVQKKRLTITLYKNNHFTKISGIIKAIDKQKRQLLIESDAAVHVILFDAIQAVDDDA